MFQNFCRNKFITNTAKVSNPCKLTRGFFDGSLLNKNKYFILNIEHKQDLKEQESYEDLYNQHLAHIKYFEDRKQILLAGSKTFYDKNNEKTNYNRSFILFEYENETVAYDFLKKDPLYAQGLVDNWEIEELEVFSRGMTKELSRVYTYLAK